MGSLVSFLSRKKREGDELQRKYREALSPSNLPREGGSYVILNVASQSSDNESDTLALTSHHKGGRRSVIVTKWKGSSHSDQVFKIEPCIDYGENCVVSCSGDKEPKLQWKTGEDHEATLEVEAYPVAGEERLRPPRKQWRFRFEERSPPGTKMYRIVGMDDDLDGIDCLAVEDIGSGHPKLVFKRRKDDDLSQLWYLT